DMDAEERTMTWTVTGARGTATSPAFAHTGNRLVLTRNRQTDEEVLGDHGDSGDGCAGGTGGDKIPMSMIEPDTAQVLHRGGVQVPPEGELDGADGDVGGGCDVGDGDVPVGVLVDERDGAAQRAGVAVVPVLAGRINQSVVREGGQGSGHQEPGGAGCE